jgi:putative tryptophan/tyrosine transport system substrate-binding protein
MRRRRLLAAGSAAIAASSTARAQSRATRRLGILTAIPTEGHRGLVALRQGLAGLGWIEGQNLQVDLRSTDARAELTALLAQQVVAGRPDAIVGHTLGCAAALKAATSTIPIVGVAIADPVRFGLVTNLPRPEANVTAFANFEPSIGGKWLEVLREVTPRLKQVGFMFNPTTSTIEEYLLALRAGAPRLGVEIVEKPVKEKTDIAHAVGSMAVGTSGLIVPPDVFLTSHADMVVGLVQKHRLPTVYAYRLWAARGGLMVYGIDTTDLFRRASTYVDRVLKGARAADLPVQYPSKFEFVINLKAARAVGLEVPAALLSRADEVIE